VTKKSKSELDKKIEGFFYCERERLIRMPDYKEAYRKYDKLAEQEGKLEDELLEDMDKEARVKLQKKRQKIQQQIDEMLKRYRTRFMPSPDKADEWKWMRAYGRAVVKELEEGEWMFAGLSTKTSKIFEVDIWREKEVILHEMSQWIDKARVSDKKKGLLPTLLDKALNPALLKRSYAVFDLRNQKPPVRYRDVALRLAKFYKSKNLKKMIDLARHDYQKAFEIIYGVRYKEFDKDKLKQIDIKPCTKCPKFKSCKELCAEAEYYVGQNEVKQQHLIGRLQDAREWIMKPEDIREEDDSR
jgi:hypothetical protein